MAEQTIKVERADAAMIITLARPEKRNALNVQMLTEIDQTLAQAESDRGLRALLIRAEGSAFCAGIDLNQASVLENAPPGQINLEKLFHRLERFPVPTIAAINGAALAGGLELALHCDLRIAAESARMGMTLARVGLMLPFSFVRKLIEIVGAAGANRLLYTAQTLDGNEALQLGMIHAMVPDDRLAETALSWTRNVAANAPLSLRAMKIAIRRAMSSAYDAPHEDIDRLIEQVRNSNDAHEGPRAFLEKRKPVWSAT